MPRVHLLQMYYLDDLYSYYIRAMPSLGGSLNLLITLIFLRLTSRLLTRDGNSFLLTLTSYVLAFILNNLALIKLDVSTALV